MAHRTDRRARFPKGAYAPECVEGLFSEVRALGTPEEAPVAVRICIAKDPQS